ncbi:MAG: ketopantoate reductase C-terminal domain-containing protein [Sulfurifustaceae bacterium]
MALDHEHARPIEIEAILGNVVRTGRRAGVDIPRLEALYAITKSSSTGATGGYQGRGVGVNEFISGQLARSLLWLSYRLPSRGT